MACLKERLRIEIQKREECERKLAALIEGGERGAETIEDLRASTSQKTNDYERRQNNQRNHRNHQENDTTRTHEGTPRDPFSWGEWQTCMKVKILVM